jgi:adenine-specific DNA methylase
VDINPIAALVQAAQVAEYEPEVVAGVYRDILDALPEDVRSWYEASCASCGGQARVRWYERIYTVACPTCAHSVALDSQSLAHTATGRKARGRYVCETCSTTFSSADTPRIGSDLKRARVKCSCGYQETRDVTADEVALAGDITSREAELVDRYGLHIPRDTIPLHWDRQFEDGLARKGFLTFDALFTSRNRLLMAFLLRGVRQHRPSLDEATYLGVVIVASALVRYVNNMTVSTPGWMDGRPAAWAKHAYWIANEFVECNPFEYLEHRLKAIRWAAEDRKRRFRGVRSTHDPADLVAKRADYCVARADARRLELPSASVDAVITDPPFGSNVQYGELTTLWSVWLQDLNPYHCDNYMNEEILVTRRRKIAAKTFEEYEQGLTAIFGECYRVLKEGGALTRQALRSGLRTLRTRVRSTLTETQPIFDSATSYREMLSTPFASSLKARCWRCLPSMSGDKMLN